MLDCDAAVYVSEFYAGAAVTDLPIQFMPDILAVDHGQAEIITNATMNCARAHLCVGIGRNDQNNAAVDGTKTDRFCIVEASERCFHATIHGRQFDLPG